MEVYHIENLTFSYPERALPAIDQLHLTIRQGEFITLCGPSGCGKTTLLRHLKPALTPHGSKKGDVFFEGQDLYAVSQREQSEKIAFVFQDPETQIVTDKVWHELAFGLENLGTDQSAIRLRVAEMAAFFGIERWFHESTSALSGGQKQTLNLAAAMTMQPAVLLLDEPTSQLDPIAATEFLSLLSRINKEFGTTVLLTEHRLEEAFPLSHRVLVMDEGRLICDGTPQEAGRRLEALEHPMLHSLPTPMRVHSQVPNDLPCPITAGQGRNWLTQYAQTHPLKAAPVSTPQDKGDAAPAVELRNLWFRYERQTPDIIKGLDLTLASGRIHCILGGNGAGKTTLLSLLTGGNKPYRGKVLLHGRNLDSQSQDALFKNNMASLPQNPRAIFVKKTVQEDLEAAIGQAKDPEQTVLLRETADLCGLTSLLEVHPYDLSGGEMQRAALAKVLLSQPKLLLLDEPTKGMDAEFKLVFSGILQALKRKGVTTILVSHDIEFCAWACDECCLLFDGAIVSQDPPRTFFGENSFYTTGANRMARHLLPWAITARDIIYACTGSAPPDPPVKREKRTLRPPQRSDGPRLTTEKPASTSVNCPNAKARLSKRSKFALLVCLIMIPITIWFGLTFLEDRKYYFISLLLLLEAMLPFVISFERRRPQARELILIAVICAIAVAGRAVFYMLPQFKPVSAIVILAAVAFGGETGFLVGAVAAFVSNLYFGQGSWTPWQMVAFGLLGLLAGLLFHNRASVSRLTLSVYGALSTFVVYGAIMNSASVLMFQGSPTAEMLITSFLMGIPFDLIHALSTALFLWLLSKPMLEKLQRVKRKYGILSYDSA